MSISKAVNHQKSKLPLNVDCHLYESSNSYRCRVDYVIKLLAGDDLGHIDTALEDVINVEKDFILGYN